MRSLLCTLFAYTVLSLVSCSPKLTTAVRTETVYRDRLVVDTVSVRIPVEIEKIITADTISHLENSFARSDAEVIGGMLHHTLESKPQVVQVPVEVHVTDTVYAKAETITKTVYVERELSRSQKIRQNLFLPLCVLCALLLLWIFRRPLLRIVGKLVLNG